MPTTTAKADVALTSVDGARYLFDVSICQPDSVQALRLRSDTKPGVAAGLTTNLKNKHYRFSDPPVTPLVWEAYGTPHKDTRKALGRIATAAAAFQRVTRDAFLRTFRARVCAALLLGTARALSHPKTMPIVLAARDALTIAPAPRPPPPRPSHLATPARRPPSGPPPGAPVTRRRCLRFVGSPPIHTLPALLSPPAPVSTSPPSAVT